VTDLRPKFGVIPIHVEAQEERSGAPLFQCGRRQHAPWTATAARSTRAAVDNLIR